MVYLELIVVSTQKAGKRGAKPGSELANDVRPFRSGFEISVA
jgi:hypothetical protein